MSSSRVSLITRRRLRLARRGLSMAAVGLAVVLGITLALRPAAPVQGAPLAPDFTLPTVSGGTLSLRALRGHPVLLNFFQSQCTECVQEMPILKQTARAYRSKGVIVLGVASGGDTLDTARSFVKAQRLPYPVVVDDEAEVAWAYDVSGWPTTFFLDVQGHARGEYMSALDRQTVRDGLAQAGAISCARCASVAPATLLANASSSAAVSGDVTALTPKRAPYFALRDQNGALITPQRFRGKVVALTFVSSVCRRQCPLIGRSLAEVRRQLGSNAQHFAIVAVSVDPEQDSPRATRAFAAESGWPAAGWRDWHYLTASRTVLSRVWRAYGMWVAPPKPGQDPAHDAYVYLIDPRGRERYLFDVPLVAPQMVSSVRALIDGR